MTSELWVDYESRHISVSGSEQAGVLASKFISQSHTIHVSFDEDTTIISFPSITNVSSLFRRLVQYLRRMGYRVNDSIEELAFKFGYNLVVMEA